MRLIGRGDGMRLTIEKPASMIVPPSAVAFAKSGRELDQWSRKDVGDQQVERRAGRQ